MELGNRLRQARLAAGLQQQEVAQLTSRAQSRVSEWENGHAEPDLATLGQLAHAYGVSFAWLVTGEGLPSPAELVWVAASAPGGAPIALPSSILVTKTQTLRWAVAIRPLAGIQAGDVVIYAPGVEAGPDGIAVEVEDGFAHPIGDTQAATLSGRDRERGRVVLVTRHAG